ncbi:hypothetical protein [Streptomyces sp. NPDC014995]|uniref:hypothetical protein n=1 Tax=Streptomyces sp. NPDC014995 TaxID=3364936 RepID=UPI0036F547CE
MALLAQPGGCASSGCDDRVPLGEAALGFENRQVAPGRIRNTAAIVLWGKS